jgi:hypothetical protein
LVDQVCGQIDAAPVRGLTEEMTGARIPWRVGTARCGEYDTTGHTGARLSAARRWYTPGLRVGGEPVEAWLAFSCQHHRDQLIAPRELLDRDGAVLADWQERERRNARGWGLHPPQPLAAGAAARNSLSGRLTGDRTVSPRHCEGSLLRNDVRVVTLWPETQVRRFSQGESVFPVGVQGVPQNWSAI